MEIVTSVNMMSRHAVRMTESRRASRQATMDEAAAAGATELFAAMFGTDADARRKRTGKVDAEREAKMEADLEAEAQRHAQQNAKYPSITIELVKEVSTSEPHKESRPPQCNSSTTKAKLAGER